MTSVLKCIINQDLIFNKDICVENQHSFAKVNKEDNFSKINPFECASNSPASLLSGKLLMNTDNVFCEDFAGAKQSLKGMLTQFGS